MGFQHGQQGEWHTGVRNHPRRSPHRRSEAGACLGAGAGAGAGVRRTRRRGFTLLELTVALGVFVVFAVALTSVTTSSLNTQSQLRARSNATLTLERALDEVIAASGFAALSRGEVIVPDSQRSVCGGEGGGGEGEGGEGEGGEGEGGEGDDCPLPPRQRQLLQECLGRLESEQQGCILAAQTVLTVFYSVEAYQTSLLGQSATPTPYAAKVFAFAQLANGTQLTVTRTAGVPVTGAGSADGYVHVVLAGVTDRVFDQTLLIDGQLTLFVPRVRLVDADGETVLDWETLTADGMLLAVADVDQECTRARPCRVELDGGRFSLSDRYVERGGTQVVLDAGRVATVALQLTTGPAAVVRLDTLPEREAALSGTPERGSVCLWGTFNVPVTDESGSPTLQQRAEVWCNNTNPQEVTIRGWSDDAGDEQELPESDLTLWVNPPYSTTVLVDADGDVVETPGPGVSELEVVDCDGESISVDNMVRWNGSEWAAGMTCTGWTWGQPTSLSTSVFAQQAYFEGQTQLQLVRSVERQMTLYWSPSGGQPAAGCSAADPTWAYPRRASARPQTWNPPAGVSSGAGCGVTLDLLREAPVWVQDTIGGFTFGVSYEATLLASGTPRPTYRVSAGQLPAGILLNADTGLLAGTPTSVGPYAFSITAENLSGTVTRAFSGTVG
jgi:prepilin-type N-terminal cleavage/methylation domain-containing protein